MHDAKEELSEQMEKFEIAIRAKGFFVLNRKFLASVSNTSILVTKYECSNVSILQLFRI